MSQTSTVTLQCLEGNFNRKAKHHFSIIIESDERFYELKNSYMQAHPSSWVDDARLWVRMRRKTVKRTCENLARQVLERSLTPCTEVRYVTTVMRDKSIHERHVTIVSVSPIDLEDLLAKKHLRHLKVDGALSRTEQGRSAVLGLSLVMAPVQSVSLVNRLVSSSS